MLATVSHGTKHTMPRRSRLRSPIAHIPPHTERPLSVYTVLARVISSQFSPTARAQRSLAPDSDQPPWRRCRASSSCVGPDDQTDLGADYRIQHQQAMMWPRRDCGRARQTGRCIFFSLGAQVSNLSVSPLTLPRSRSFPFSPQHRCGTNRLPWLSVVP